MAITLLVRGPLLSVPFERDEGEYAYIGWRLGHGELPYRDWVDQKPPAIFWIYRMALMLPGDSVVAVHLFAALWSAVSAWALYLLARRLMSSSWAVVPAGLFAILSAHPIGEGTAANTEIFMLLPMILAVWIFLRCADPPRNKTNDPAAPDRQSSGAVPQMLACGALIGVATAFKQVAALNWPLLVCLSPFLISTGTRPRWRTTVKFTLWSGTGAAFVWLLIAGYFFLRGGFSDLLYNVLTHNLEYIHATPWSERMKLCAETLTRLSRVQAIAWGFAALGIVAAARQPSRSSLLLLVGWLAASFGGVSASGYYFPHYFQQLLPAIALASGFGAQAVARGLARKGISKYACGAVVAALLALLPLATWLPFARMAPRAAARRIFPFNIFAEMPQIGGYIAQNTKPDDRVFVFGAEAEILFYAKRVSATRYIFLFPLYGPYRNAREKQQTTAQEVAKNAPAIVAYFPNGLFYKAGTEQFFSQWTESFLREHFRPDVYVTRDLTGAAQFTKAADGQTEFVARPGEQLLGIIFVRRS